MSKELKISIVIVLLLVFIINLFVVIHMTERFDESWNRVDDAMDTMDAMEKDYQATKEELAALKAFVAEKYPNMERNVQNAQTRASGWLDNVRDRWLPENDDQTGE